MEHPRDDHKSQDRTDPESGFLILAEPEEEEDKEYYQKIQVAIKAAADEGLIDLEAIESENQIENTSNTTTEDTLRCLKIDVDVEVIENENSCVFCCNVM